MLHRLAITTGRARVRCSFVACEGDRYGRRKTRIVISCSGGLCDVLGGGHLRIGWIGRPPRVAITVVSGGATARRYLTEDT